MEMRKRWSSDKVDSLDPLHTVSVHARQCQLVRYVSRVRVAPRIPSVLKKRSVGGVTRRRRRRDHPLDCCGAVCSRHVHMLYATRWSSRGSSSRSQRRRTMTPPSATLPSASWWHPMMYYRATYQALRGRGERKFCGVRRENRRVERHFGTCSR